LKVDSIYLDHNATTPVDPEVKTEMLASLDTFGNPSSLHAAGQEARRIIDTARARVARLINAQPDEIIFTSGGTEADNLAIFGAVSRAGFQPGSRRILLSAIEHQAVLNPCLHLKTCGHDVHLLPVDGEGILNIALFKELLVPETALVSVMLANNDTGSIQPVAEIAGQARKQGALVHTDAVQAAGKMKLDVRALNIDLLSLSAHKLHGPKGIGALYIRKGIKIDPIIFGGHQERGLRPGTENVNAIAGFGKACELALQRMQDDAARLLKLRDSLEQIILGSVEGAAVNGQNGPRLPNTSNLSFEGLDGEMLAINLDLLGVEVSTGAACSSADKEPSHVLLAMGRTEAQAASSIRVSLGRDNTEEQILKAVEKIKQTVQAMRSGKK
jgi:cysteine desulfurase